MPRARVALALALVFAIGCERRAGSAAEAFERGVAFLAKAQASDGGWHSAHYGVLHGGASLTALVLYTLALAPPPLRDAHSAAIERGFAFLAAATDADGVLGLRDGPADYPSYAAAYYLLALAAHQPEGWEPRAQAQIAQLRRVQLAEDLGWEPSDAQYGGFGFGGRMQRKPLDDELLNVSVTAIVLEALRAAGVPPSDPLFAKAAGFVERCQRMAPSDALDGGFTFTLPSRVDASKAGRRTIAGADVPLPYGPPTADGIRALLACGYPPTHPRVRAACAFLERTFTVERTPGFPDDPAAIFEPGLRFYGYASLARALASAPIAWPWREALRDKLLDLQRGDGSWASDSSVMKEDDPLVTTPLALVALACAGAQP